MIVARLTIGKNLIFAHFDHQGQWQISDRPVGGGLEPGGIGLLLVDGGAIRSIWLRAVPMERAYQHPALVYDAAGYVSTITQSNGQVISYGYGYGPDRVPFMPRNSWAAKLAGASATSALTPT
jgi:hypothetical protein